MGLTFDDGASVGEIVKAAAETWSGAGINAGTAGWFRFQRFDTNLATTQAAALAAEAAASDARFDGSIAASGAQLNTTNTGIAVGAVQTINTFSVTLPGEV